MCQCIMRKSQWQTHLSCGTWRLQDLVKGVENIQDQHPGRAQNVMKPVGNVEQGPQCMHILGCQYNPC